MPENPPPGVFVLEELEARSWTQRDLAFVLDVDEKAINLLTTGKRGISADMAKKLGDAFDVPAEFFINLQRIYDLANAPDPDPGVAKKARLQTLYPIREMIRRQWFVNADDPAMLEREVSRFFEVDSVDAIPHYPHAAKKSDYDSIPPAQLAWLFRVRQIARGLSVPRYSDKMLREALVRLRAMTIAPEEARNVPRTLTECGVRFILVESLPSAKIDGVCFWLENSPVIGLSMRYDRIDNFWFVLRHEIEHVLRRHGTDVAMLDTELEKEKAGTGQAIPDEERLANQAAIDFAVPSEEIADFIARRDPFFSEESLLGFAKRIQVDPGIVAGQLRSRTQRWNLFSKHLCKMRHIVSPSAIVDGWGTPAPTT